MKGSLLQLFYPNRCLFCHASLPTARQLPVCPACMAVFHRYLPLALQTIEPETGWAALPYDAKVRSVIHRFKFYGKAYYAPTLALFLRVTLERAMGKDAARAFDGVSWVPVSTLRRFRRGYDQSRCLAKETAKLLELPLIPTLRKVSHNRPQSSLDGEQRFANVQGVYRVRNENVYPDQRILLIDDVCTTGSTVREACRTLRASGVQPTVLCLARAGHYSGKQDEGK